MAPLPPWAYALLWLAFPVWVVISVRRSRSLNDYAPLASGDAPRVTVIVPARNEAPNIERCVRSILATSYAHVELIVVDDHSTDATSEIAQRAAAGDTRAQITTPAALPADWFGKQWACAHGASRATGQYLLFTDADTWHAPDLIPRAVSAFRARGADLLSVIGRQETVTFWERVVQPTVFLALIGGVGSLESMSHHGIPRRKAANGQFILVARDTYHALGGHTEVRAYVAEDIMLAQRWCQAGKHVHALMALDQLSTRMYRSLGELMSGWRKNAWAGGRHAFGSNTLVRGAMRVLLPLSPLFGVVPVAALLLGISGIASHAVLMFGAWAYVFETAGLIAAFTAMRLPRTSAFLYPLGCLICTYVFAGAAIRGDRTEWKGREYVAA